MQGRFGRIAFHDRLEDAGGSTNGITSQLAAGFGPPLQQAVFGKKAILAIPIQLLRLAGLVERLTENCLVVACQVGFLAVPMSQFHMACHLAGVILLRRFQRAQNVAFQISRRPGGRLGLLPG